MSERQVKRWVQECLRAHMKPDVLSVEGTPDGKGTGLWVRTRKAGTENETGGLYFIQVIRILTD